MKMLLLLPIIQLLATQTTHAFTIPTRMRTSTSSSTPRSPISMMATTTKRPPSPTSSTPSSFTTPLPLPTPPLLSATTHPIPQILAPAGGREQLLAALNAGADQVFLGLKGTFNARQRAENFSLQDLRELVPLAHRFSMQVLVTVNVLIKENELAALIETLAALEELEVDAIIVQDQAVGAIAQRFFPTLRLHASTQMAVHNLQGVVKASALGYKRVVLARELTAKEMKDIRAAVRPDVTQLEAFVHGSLCYSYSGLCFFSGEQDARSGNRGECAYTCRQPYKLTNEDGMGFLFSMMDLDTSHDLDLLADAGIDTLKIEGRKKDAQYVSSSVTLYRRRLDELYGRPTLRSNAPPEAMRSTGQANKRTEQEIRKDLSLSFHRGTTSFFVRGRYHENVIDLGNAGHLGVPAGRVSSISKDGKTFRFVTELDLERYDGLKVVPPSRAFHSTPQHGKQKQNEHKDTNQLLHDTYNNDLPEFSLRNFKVNSAKAYEASAGATVDVEIPLELRRTWQQQPLQQNTHTHTHTHNFYNDNDNDEEEGNNRRRPIKVGDLIFQSRSNELKRRVEALAVVPEGYKAKEWGMIDVNVCVIVNGNEGENESGKGLEVQVTVSKLGHVLVKESIGWEVLEYAKSKTKEDVIADVVEVLGTFGELGLRAHAVVIDGLGGGGEEGEGGDEEIGEGGGGKKVPFIPRKDLKALKQKISAQLGPVYAAFWEERKERALQALGLEATTPTTTRNDEGEQQQQQKKKVKKHKSKQHQGDAFAPSLSLPRRDWDERRFAIKIDRPEYLEMLDVYFIQVVRPEGLGDLIEEVVFEPKRMYLAKVKAEEGVGMLLAFGRKHGVKVRLALPTVIREWDVRPLKGWVEEFVRQQHQQQEEGEGGGEKKRTHFEVGNLGAWGLLEEWGVLGGEENEEGKEESAVVDVSTDFALYSLNSQASAVWAETLDATKIALSVEDDATNLKAHMKAWTKAVGGDAEKHAPQYVLYTDTPLFKAEACSLTALNGNVCPGSKVCGYRTLEIENDAGEKFEVAHEHCKSIVYSTNAQSLVHKQRELLDMGIRQFRVDFLTRKYEMEHLFQVLDGALRRREDDPNVLPQTHSANFDRTLL